MVLGPPGTDQRWPAWTHANAFLELEDNSGENHAPQWIFKNNKSTRHGFIISEASYDHIPASTDPSYPFPAYDENGNDYGLLPGQSPGEEDFFKPYPETEPATVQLVYIGKDLDVWSEAEKNSVIDVLYGDRAIIDVGGGQPLELKLSQKDTKSPLLEQQIFKIDGSPETDPDATPGQVVLKPPS